MSLDRLNYWRTLRGYSIRELALLCDLDPSTIWQIEKHNRPAYGSTARKLAQVLAVEVSDLFSAPIATELIQVESDIQEEPYNKHTEDTKPARSTRAKKQPAGSCWVIDQDGDAFGPFALEEAERLKGKLGQARVYEAASKAEARELHRAFLVRVARGHDSW